jgi:hypothetical protein
MPIRLGFTTLARQSVIPVIIISAGDNMDGAIIALDIALMI